MVELDPLAGAESTDYLEAIADRLGLGLRALVVIAISLATLIRGNGLFRGCGFFGLSRFLRSRSFGNGFLSSQCFRSRCFRGRCLCSRRSGGSTYGSGAGRCATGEGPEIVRVGGSC